MKSLWSGSTILPCLVLIYLLIALPAVAADRLFRSDMQGPPQPVTVEAHVIEASGADNGSLTLHAYGDVRFNQGTKFLRGDEFFYNGAIQTGILRNAMFTTCPKEHPDYRITAREIRLTPSQHIILRHASIYLGSVKLLTVPKLSMHVGGGGGAPSLLPSPGYDGRDGFFLETGYPLRQTGEDDFSFHIRFTQLRSIQGGVSGGHVIRGNALATPPYIPDNDTELRRTSILRPELNEEGSVCIFRGKTAEPQLISVFGAAISRDQVPDIDHPGLLVSRLPELGVRLISRQKCIAEPDQEPALGIQGQVRASWGRFLQSEGPSGYINRFDVRGTGSVSLATLGKSTALRGGGLARFSAYGTGDDYRVVGTSLDVSRIFPGGSFASVRLINHWTKGTTPLLFDDIDIPHEIQWAGRYVRDRDSFTILADYDLGRDSLRGWQFVIAHRTDCLEPSLSFSTGLRGIAFRLRVLGL